jgi:polar amino acid transport system substrate-binding protein
MIRALLFALALTGSMTGSAQAETLRIGTETDYRPYIFHTKSGQRAGFDVDLMALICKRGGFDCVWDEVSFDHIVTGVAKGQFDVSIGGIGTTPQRDLLVDWTRPYRVIETGISHFAALDANVDVTEARIGVQGETIMEDVLADNGYVAITFPSNSAVIEALLAGDVDVIFTTSSYLTQVEENTPLIDLGYLSYPDGGPQIAVPKGDDDLRRRLNGLIDGLEADGSLTMLNAIWFPQGNETEL